MNMAPNIGAVATPLIVPALAITLGWQMAFVTTGALGFVWLVAWLLLPRPVQVAGTHVETEARSPTGIRSLRSILTNRNAWAFAIAKLLTDFVWAFLLFWGPDLFNKRYGLDTAGLALPVATIFVMAAAGSIFGGWLSGRLLRSGRSLDVARKTPMLISAIAALPVPLMLLAPNLWVGVGLLGLTLAAHQCFSANLFGLATDLFPTRMIGVVIGFGATFGNLSGLAMLELTGFVLDSTGSYLPMLLLCAGGYASALLSIVLMVPSIDSARPDEPPGG
jgi:ACS family hexuronate transporter-like MFS transporter